jgi:hypothetical protein
MCVGIAVYLPRTSRLCPRRYKQAETYHTTPGKWIISIDSKDILLREGVRF